MKLLFWGSQQKFYSGEKWFANLFNQTIKESTTSHTEEGALAVEYAIMASAIAAVIVAIVTSVGGKTLTNFIALSI